jgi:hypothetical protein
MSDELNDTRSKNTGRRLRKGRVVDERKFKQSSLRSLRYEIMPRPIYTDVPPS